MGAAVKSAIAAEGFAAKVDHRGNTLVVSMRGNADMAIHAQLKAFLDDLQEAARAAHAKEAVFEFQELYFMNSSCLSLLLRFINVVVETNDSDQYIMRFKSNPKLRWQKKSLDALRAYAPGLVFVE